MEKTPGQNEGLIVAKCEQCGRLIDCPARFDGKSAKCPKCGKYFTVSEYRPDSVSKPKTKPKVLAAPTGPVCQAGGVCGLGIASLAMGIVACVTCWVPFLGALSIPVSVIGVFFGIASGVVSLATKRNDGHLAGCGVFVCLTAVVVFVFAQAWFNAEVDRAKDLLLNELDASIRVGDGVIYVGNDGPNAWTGVTVTICDDFSYCSGMIPGRTVSEVPVWWFRDPEGRALTLGDYDDVDVLIESDNGTSWLQ